MMRGTVGDLYRGALVRVSQPVSLGIRDEYMHWCNFRPTVVFEGPFST